MNVPVVKCFVEFLGVGGMFGGGSRKIVPSAEIFLCTEEKIVGFFVFEHGVDRGSGGDADGSRGEAGVAVGIVGTVVLEHVAADATDGEVADGILDGGVGLKGHADAVAVEVDGGDVGFLVVGVGLLFNNGGDGEHLLAGEANGFELELAFIPEIVRLAFHTVEQGSGSGGPVELVGVLKEETDDGQGSLAIAGTGLVRLHEAQQAVGLQGEPCAEVLAQVLNGAVFVDGDADGVLVA